MPDSGATKVRELLIRGYDVDEYSDGHCVIKLGTRIVDTQPTIDQARAAINKLKAAEGW
jgi:hypothetical protein